MRYVIIDPDEGIFLGTKKDEEMGGMGMLFSAHNFLSITRATCWETREEATSYMYRHIKRHLEHCFVAEIDSVSKDKFVDIPDICRSGFGCYAWDMIDAMPTPSQALH
jgi:hypothetical protein